MNPLVLILIAVVSLIVAVPQAVMGDWVQVLRSLAIVILAVEVLRLQRAAR